MADDPRLTESKRLWRDALREYQEAAATTDEPSRTKLSKAAYTMVGAFRALTHEYAVELSLAEPVSLRYGGELAAGVYRGNIRDPRVHRQGETTYVVVTLKPFGRPELHIMLPDPDAFTITALDNPISPG